MRISDWSSDVCSSDLNISRKMFHNVAQGHCTGHRGSLGHPAGGVQHSAKSVARCCTGGRRSCRHPHKTERNPTRFPPACRATLREKRSEEHTSELQSLMRNSDAVFCVKKKQTVAEIETPLGHHSKQQ